MTFSGLFILVPVAVHLIIEIMLCCTAGAFFVNVRFYIYRDAYK